MARGRRVSAHSDTDVGHKLTQVTEDGSQCAESSAKLFDGQAQFVGWLINVGAEPPPYVETIVAPYGRVQAYNVLLAVVFRTARGNLDGWQSIAGGNLVLSPFISQIEQFTLTWNVYGL